jgi:hypothetical protein
VSSAATISPSSPGVRTARRWWPPRHVGMPLVRDQAAGVALGPRAARGFPLAVSPRMAAVLAVLRAGSQATAPTSGSTNEPALIPSARRRRAR